ncbi:hypothetical protein NDA13_004295 [Ustilago tritici]|nr:hypothetical protein NDA13_004295 [Ustilago tritici]
MSEPSHPAYTASPELIPSLPLWTNGPRKPKSTKQPALATPTGPADSIEEEVPISKEDQKERESYNPKEIQCDNLDLNQYWPPTVASQEEAQDDNNKGNINFEAQGQEGNKEGTEAAGAGGISTKSAEPARVMGLLLNSAKRTITCKLEKFAKGMGLPPILMKQMEARLSSEKAKHPKVHGNEFVMAERLIQAALADRPIGFMLLDIPPSSLPAFGFVPTGADRGVEMEVEADKKVTPNDIPKPYQYLRDMFDKVEVDKLPHHTEHNLHLELMEGSRLPQDPLYLKGPKEMAKLRK